MDISQDETANSNGAIDIHAPFTKAERMQQLSEIDRDISSLLEITSRALGALVKPPSAESDNTPTTNPNGSEPAAAPPPAAAAAPPTQEQQQQQKAAFEAASNEFFSTLLSVHVRLKRQIWGLEEAGIITLKDVGGKAKGGGAGAPAPAPNNGVVPPLEPNGVGAMGGLDVGWLNSRSSKVDRDMEAELWAHARTHLEGAAAAAFDGAGGDVDVPMAG